MCRSISFMNGSRNWLAAAVMLLVGQGAASAQSTAFKGAEPTILVADIHDDNEESMTQPDIGTRAEMRTALAAHLRRQVGAVITPPLSVEEKKCGTVACAVQITRLYRADYLLSTGISASKRPDGQGQCALSFVLVPAPRGDSKALPRAVTRDVPMVSCAPEALSSQINSVSASMLNAEIGVAQRPPPPCRYNYDNRARGIATGIGLGLTVAGAGLGFGSLVEQSRTYDVTGAPELKAHYGSVAGGIGTGFGAMAAGVALTGTALTPWERIVSGENQAGCTEPKKEKYGLRRSAIVSFFATSLAASLLSTIYFAAPHSPTVTNLPPGYTLNSSSLRPGYLAGSSVFVGGYALGLALSIFLP